ncbi:MAG: hypothetical protein QW607_09840 [Desulfurococcaceae archaeon]
MDLRKGALILLFSIMLFVSIVFSMPYWQEDYLISNYSKEKEISITIRNSQRILNITKIENRVEINTVRGNRILIEGEIDYDQIRRVVKIYFEKDGRVIEKELEIEKFERLVDNIEYLNNVTINNFGFKIRERIRNRIELRGNKEYIIVESEIPVRVLWIFRLNAKVGVEAEVDEELNIKSYRFIRPWWWIFVTKQE